MAYPAEEEPYQFDCPLCGNPQQVKFRGEDTCSHCGAELGLFRSAMEANQFAEEQKSRGETAHWRKVLEQQYWIVAHKGTPTNMSNWARGG